MIVKGSQQQVHKKSQKKMRPDIAEQLRIAIRNCGLSENKLAEKTGVPQPTINRFMNGQDMRIQIAAKIAKFLKLDLHKQS